MIPHSPRKRGTRATDGALESGFPLSRERRKKRITDSTCPKPALALATLLLAAPGARAGDLPGWDRTRWGMNSAEIAKLYGDAAIRLDGRVEFAGLYSDLGLRRVPFAGLDFIVYFQMDGTHRLAQVLLERLKQRATGAAWEATLGALEGAYGAAAARCDRRGDPLAGAPAVIERVWTLPTTTVRASFIATGAASPEQAPGDDGDLARRLLIRYAPTRAGAPVCAQAR